MLALSLRHGPPSRAGSFYYPHLVPHHQLFFREDNIYFIISPGELSSQGVWAKQNSYSERGFLWPCIYLFILLSWSMTKALKDHAVAFSLRGALARQQSFYHDKSIWPNTVPCVSAYHQVCPFFFLAHHPQMSSNTSTLTLALTSCSIVVINGDIIVLLLIHIQLWQLSLNLMDMKMILRILLAL